MMKINLKKIWSIQESGLKSGYVKEQIPGIGSLKCFIGLIPLTNAKLFQLELPAQFEVHKNYLKKFRGVEIQILPDSENNKMFTIILLDNDITDIFALFIEDILNQISLVSDETQALNVISQRINYWKKLFGKITGELLSSERQRGLFGELFFLNILLDRKVNSQYCLRSWQGAFGTHQDFIFDDKAVEIKTSKSTNLFVNISNELQLDNSILNKLYLGVIKVNETVGETNTLFNLIQQIQSFLNHDPELIQEFITKLDNAGIPEEMIDYYNDISFVVRNLHFFEIRDGFPSITPSSLPSEALCNVKYQIDLSSCATFEIDKTEVIRNIL